MCTFARLLSASHVVLSSSFAFVVPESNYTRALVFNFNCFCSFVCDKLLFKKDGFDDEVCFEIAEAAIGVFLEVVRKNFSHLDLNPFNHSRMSSSTLPLFWNLASSDLNERINSSSTLLDSLIKQQNSLPSSSTTTATSSHPSTSIQSQSSIDLSESRIPKDLSTASPDELELADKVLDESLASEVAYSLTRLLKGLASPRENSRLGFAVALTEVSVPLINSEAMIDRRVEDRR